LIDEDTAATNFMIRDDKMMQLVAPDKEPITPFVRLVRSLYEETGISTVLVIGGSGDFFDVADTVLVMDCYKCQNATARAKQIASNAAAAKLSTEKEQHSYSPGLFQQIRSGGKRFPVGNKYDPDGKVRIPSKIVVSYGDTELNLAGMEQIVSKAQTNAISAALQRVVSLLASTNNTDNLPLEQVLSQLEALLASDGLYGWTPGQFNGALAKPRRSEIAGAINRLRRSGSIVQR